MKKKAIMMLSVLPLALIVVVSLSQQEATGGDKGVAVVAGSGQQGGLSAADAKTTIRHIAQREKVSVAEIENRVADRIAADRAFLKRAAGGLDPGAHIVSIPQSPPIDPKAIRIVPVGQTMNLDRDFTADAKFRTAANDPTFKNVYLDPIDVAKTDLKAARFEGFYEEGNYLRGGDYATTDRLRNVEKTPSGKTGWTGLLRIYSDYPGLGRVALREQDNVAGHVAVRIPATSINAKVADYPATLTRLRDAGGKTMSAVQWIGPGGRTNSLYIAQVDDASVATMMRLADSLAREDR